jgi:hypothetical protein
MSKEIRPNKSELAFLSIAYNRFYDIYEEVFTDQFWEHEDLYRFAKIKDGFAVYTELLNYKPIQWVLEDLKKSRPPMESEIANDLFKFIRNVILHFPFYNSWNEVWISKSLINWNSEGRSIDRFLKSYSGKQEVKYRFWELDKKLMTYLSIKFPPNYLDDSKIYLKDILSEKEGVKFSYILMKKVIDTQVEK